MDEEKKNVLTVIAKTGLTIGGVIGAIKIYNTIFKRYNRPDYKTSPGLYYYERVKDILRRKEMSFVSKHNKLNAYYYETPNPYGLVVLVHGFHSGSDEYLPIIIYLVKNGFNVFTYDGTGTYESEGKSLVGFSQGLVDLDYALEFIKNNKLLSKFPLFLLGHSCGGFAVNAILNKRTNVKAVASIAAVNNCYKLILEKGYQYAGNNAGEGLPKVFLDEYQKILFGDYTKYVSTDGINNVRIPILLAHGISDETIDFELQSVISHKEEFTNPNVQFYYGTGNQGGHCSIWHSEQSNDHQEEVDKMLKSLKDDENAKAQYVSSVNHYLYSEINYQLFDLIIKLFKNA